MHSHVAMTTSNAGTAPSTLLRTALSAAQFRLKKRSLRLERLAFDVAQAKDARNCVILIKQPYAGATL